MLLILSLFSIFSLSIASGTNEMEAQPLHVKTGSGSKTVRIVHISDTHQKEDFFLKRIPAGDILVHSGDFTNFWHKMTEDTYESSLKTFDTFLGKLPHKHKIFVSGNHENILPFHSKEETAKLLTNCTYLQDSGVVIEGIRFYGSPWTHTKNGFVGTAEHVKSMWEKIPSDTDVLITHSPPYDILDTFFFMHWGCRDLRERVFKIKPKIHLFGHVHEDAGVQVLQDILFSNAAMHRKGQPVIIDFSYTPSDSSSSADSSASAPAEAERKEKSGGGGLGPAAARLSASHGGSRSSNSAGNSRADSTKEKDKGSAQPPVRTGEL